MNPTLFTQLKPWLYSLVLVSILSVSTYALADKGGRASHAHQKDVKAIKSMATKVFTELTQKLPSNKNEAQHKKILNSLVETYFDLDYFTAAVTGKYYRKLSKKQLQKLQVALKSNFIGLYHSALDDPNLAKQMRKSKLKVFDPILNAKGTSAKSRMILMIEGRESPIEIVLSFRKKKGKWKAVNSTLMGINYGINLRGAFYSAMTKYKSDFDKVIAAFIPKSYKAESAHLSSKSGGGA